MNKEYQYAITYKKHKGATILLGIGIGLLRLVLFSSIVLTRAKSLICLCLIKATFGNGMLAVLSKLLRLQSFQV